MTPKINLAAAAIRPHQTSSAETSPDVEPARVMPPLTARAGSSFRRFISHIPIAHDETISLRDETRQVMCGDCGIHTNSRDHLSEVRRQR
jgi:succinate dehydrogenase/fumarate reductase-like Fe-S protein